MKIKTSRSHLLFALPLIVVGTLAMSQVACAARAPVMEQGIQFGDLQYGRVMVWSRIGINLRKIKQTTLISRMIGQTTITRNRGMDIFSSVAQALQHVLNGKADDLAKKKRVYRAAA